MPETTAALDSQQFLDIVHDDEKKGATVHSFHPDEPPHLKAAAAAQSKENLKTVAHPNGGGKEVALDSSSRAPAAPTITISGAEAPLADEQPTTKNDSAAPHAAEDIGYATPGALPAAVAAAIPDWYRVGWRAVSGIDHTPSAEEADKSILAAFIKEHYYGDWYHNAGIIFFAVLMSHYLTVFNMGWGSLLILLAICCVYYTTSVRRVRRRARDDIQRELLKTRLLSEHETADWINNFLERFWLIYEPVLSATIVSSVDQILSASTPPFLDSIRLTTFTLGTKAPRIDKVRTFPKTAEDVVLMDWGISFTPNDVSDLTPRQAASKINPKIVLSLRLGKGFATAAIPVLLEDITFTGLMRIKMNLGTSFPHVHTVGISFLGKPHIDYVLKPIGGETFGFDIANVPGLSTFVRDMTHATLGPMMYEPNVFSLNLEQLLSGAPIDSAIGVLQVTVFDARDLKGTKIGGGTPDPYVGLSINMRAELARTTHKHSTTNPGWDETKFILINSLTETLTLKVKDYNDHRKDSEMGVASFELVKLQEDATQDNIVASVLKDGKERGELRFSVSFYPVLSNNNTNHSSVGIVRLTIHQAKELDRTKSLSGELNPVAKVFLGSSHPSIHTTPRFKHTNNPVWESSAEFLCAHRATSVISIKVINDRDLISEPVVGYISVKLEDLLKASKEGHRDWWPLSGCQSGKIRLSTEWKPLNMPGSLQGAEHYVPPIGIVRLRIQKATDVKNVEAPLGGKSDPYVRVSARSITIARTEVINNDLNPVWDQFIYVPVHSTKEIVLLECMDYQHLTKDRPLGAVELRVSDLAQESTANKEYPYVSLEKKEYVERLRLDKVFLKGVSFDTEENEMQRMTEKMDENTRPLQRAHTDSISSTSSSEHIPTVTVTDEESAGEENGFVPGHVKNAKSSNTVRTVNSTDTAVTRSAAGTPTPSDESKYEGVEMSKEELLKCQSGIIVFNIIRGQLAKKSRLEVLVDEGYWPSVATSKSHSTHAQFDHVGEGFVKELDFGRIWMRLNEHDENAREDIIAELKMDAKTFLEVALDGPRSFTLRGEDYENESVVEISAKYIPVDIVLEPKESHNNHGILRIELIDGQEILAADRSGKSDPYAVFNLNNHKVFRSQVIKKTLAPEWNEIFEVSVPSRVGSRFEVEVFDWNQIEASKSLGVGVIDLESLEPLQGTAATIPLSTAKLGVKGQVRINLLFRPAFVARSRKPTSTIQTAGRAMTQVGGLPLGAGKGIIQGVGTASKTFKGVFRLGNASKASLEVPQIDQARGSGIPMEQVSRPADVVDGAAAAVIPVSDSMTNLPSTAGAQPPREYGNLKVTVLGAQDLSAAAAGETIKPYVAIKVGDKEQKTKHAGKTGTPEWDESFRFLAGPETKSFVASIYDHKTIGKDRLLGEVDVDIWRHVQPYAPVAEVWVELRDGQGQLRLRLEFESAPRPSSGSTPSSPSRFTSLRSAASRVR